MVMFIDSINVIHNNILIINTRCINLFTFINNIIVFYSFNYFVHLNHSILYIFPVKSTTEAQM